MVKKYLKKIYKFIKYKCKNKKIKLFMTYLLRNEEEIIEKVIRFHSNMGVDGFIVCLHRCTDNTKKILIKLKNEGFVIHIIEKTEIEYLQNIWVKEMILIAKNKFKANWVINADADEFYYSDYLDLKQSINNSGKANLIWVDSIFLFPEYTSNFINSTYFVKKPLLPFEANQLGVDKLDIYKEYIGSQGCKKVILRTRDFKSISYGNHDAKMRMKREIQSPNIRLYHYHIRSYDEWIKKIERFVESINTMEGDLGSHMKKMINLYKKGNLKLEFDKKYSIKMRDNLIEHGVVVKDPSVLNFLKYKNII